MLKEIPFPRTSEEIRTLSSPSITPSRFVGVFVVKNGKDETLSFGAAIPQFYVGSCEWSSKVERTSTGYIVPRIATVNGQPLLLRIGIDDENVAGKLFSFCYRIMYGSDAVSDILADRSSNLKSSAHDKETIAGPT